MDNKNGKIIWGFKKAFDGFRETIIKEKSFNVMVIIAVVVIFFLFYFPTSRTEKAVIFATIFLVLALELINSTVERIMDFVAPEKDERVRIIKDLMAAIVLFTCFGAVVIGFIVFYPYFRLFFP